MFDQILSKAEGLQTGLMGFVLNNWIWLAALLVVLGFALDQLLYFLMYKPWRRWMHNLRVFRRFLERLFRIQLPWPPDVKPMSVPSRAPAENDPDAPVVVRSTAPANRLKTQPLSSLEFKPFEPLPRPAKAVPGRPAARPLDPVVTKQRPDAKAAAPQEEPITLRNPKNAQTESERSNNE